MLALPVRRHTEGSCFTTRDSTRLHPCVERLRSRPPYSDPLCINGRDEPGWIGANMFCETLSVANPDSVQWAIEPETIFAGESQDSRRSALLNPGIDDLVS